MSLPGEYSVGLGASQPGSARQSAPQTQKSRLLLSSEKVIPGPMHTWPPSILRKAAQGTGESLGLKQDGVAPHHVTRAPRWGYLSPGHLSAKWLMLGKSQGPGGHLGSCIYCGCISLREVKTLIFGASLKKTFCFAKKKKKKESK